MNELLHVELPTASPAESNAPKVCPILEVDQLVRIFGKLRAVNGISFSAMPGEIVGFIGPNGSGKTTTMRIIATLDSPDSGDVRVSGHSVIDYPDRIRKLIGYLPDSFGKYANMNVLDYLDFFARAYGLRGAARDQAVQRVLTFTDLRRLELKSIRTLSKGQTQRLGLGRTLIHNPPVLILDEPAAGLDPRARIELRELVLLLARELGKTVLISSHILTELGEIADSVVIIEAGSVLAKGKVSEVQRLARSARQSEAISSTIAIRFIHGTGEDGIQSAVHWLIQQPHVGDCRASGDTVLAGFSGSEGDQHELLKRLLQYGFPVVGFEGKTETLEDAFMHITRGIMQ